MNPFHCFHWYKDGLELLCFPSGATKCSLFLTTRKSWINRGNTMWNRWNFLWYSRLYWRSGFLNLLIEKDDVGFVVGFYDLKIQRKKEVLIWFSLVNGIEEKKYLYLILVFLDTNVGMSIMGSFQDQRRMICTPKHSCEEFGSGKHFLQVCQCPHWISMHQNPRVKTISRLVFRWPSVVNHWEAKVARR